jgi:ABC-2 type transport system ATP-binding protein
VTAEAPRATAIYGSPVTPRLLLEGIRKQWDKRKPPLLDDIHLELAPGSIVSLVGENGVGKTTFLRIVAGLIFADSGRVQLDGLDPARHRAEYQRRLGFLASGSSGLYARLSPVRHLEFATRIAFVRGSNRAALADEAVARFGLAEVARQRVDRLSMGQRQRVRLAMAFVHRPQLVLLDEPWNSLDEEGSRVVAETLIAFRQKGGTAICCTPTGTDIAARIPDIDSILQLTSGKLTLA